MLWECSKGLQGSGAAERVLTLARLFLRKMGARAENRAGGPVPVLRHLRAAGLALGKQSRARAQFCRAGCRREASRDEKAISRRISVWGFADF